MRWAVTILATIAVFAEAWYLFQPDDESIGGAPESRGTLPEASGRGSAMVVHKPRLLSDNGSSYVAGDLADLLEDKGMDHVRGAPHHPQTQGKIERWHQTMKNRILLEDYFLPGDAARWGGSNAAVGMAAIPRGAHQAEIIHSARLARISSHGSRSD